MCGRYSITSPVEALQQMFLFEETPNLKPRYNVASTQEVPAVRLENYGKRHLRLLHWGLLPFWAKDPTIGNRMINARAETVATKPAFRAAFRPRRCLVLADGFYEWQPQEAGPKQPYRVVMKDGDPIAFAGLWERWTDKDQSSEIESCTIIVTDVNDLLRPIHNRMPVILDPADYDNWLDPEVPGARSLLQPCPDGWLEAYPVSRRVNKPQNDDPECIKRLGTTN